MAVMTRDEFYARLALLGAESFDYAIDGGRRCRIRLPDNTSIAIREWGGTYTYDTSDIWVRVYVGPSKRTEKDCKSYQEAADAVIKWMQEICDESR